MMLFDDTQVWSVVGQVFLVGLAVFAIVTTVKRALRAADIASCLDSGVGQAGLILAPVVLGLLLAMLPGVFADVPVDAAGLLGVCGGFFSKPIYEAVKTRFPEAVVAGRTRGGA